MILPHPGTRGVHHFPWQLDREGIELWLEFEYEAIRYGVDMDISRDDLAALIDAPCVVMERAEHRATHSEGHPSNFVRWGAEDGSRTPRHRRWL